MTTAAVQLGLGLGLVRSLELRVEGYG